MSWLDLPRVPEPEVMDDSGEVEAYASAAAQRHLSRIDDTFVEHALRLVAGCPRGRALDIGTGPGQIVLKLARRLPGWQFVGVDRAANMIAQARADLAHSSGHGLSRAEKSELRKVASAPEASRGVPLANRVEFLLADGGWLPFPYARFDLVMCNSVLHHIAERQRLLAEIARVVKPRGAILIRDLRRPSRLAYPLHVRWHGRHYSGTMYQLFCASVRSAYTAAELEELLRQSPLRGGATPGATVFTYKATHLGLERPTS